MPFIRHPIRRGAPRPAVRPIRRRWVRPASLAATGAIAAALVFSGATAAMASTAAPASATSSCSVAEHLRSVFEQMPAQLRHDLRDLKALPVDQRRAATAQIRRDALDGAYGEEAQDRAKQLVKLRATAWAEMPEELRSDLRDLRTVPSGEQRREAAARIAQAAVAGEYGTAVQDAAEKIQDSDLWQACVAG